MKNKVSLIGRVGKELEVINFENGQTLAKFSVATTDKFKDSKGELQENTTWHDIVCWGKQAEIIGKYVSRGMLVSVEGKITNSQYETKEGEKRTKTQISCDSFLMLSKPQNKDVNNNSETEGNDDLPF